MLFNRFPSQLEINLSEECNLDCKYCYLIKGKPNKISFIDLKKAIDIFYEQPSHNKTISFGGGEPLLKFDLLSKVISYAWQKASQKHTLLKIVVNTNATLLNKEKFDFLKSNNVDICLSIDGRKNYHDINRRFKNNNAPSFEVIYSNIKNIDRKITRIMMVFNRDTYKGLIGNIKFLIEEGFYNFDFFPDIFTAWTDKELSKIRDYLEGFVKLYIFFIKNKNIPLNWGMLNRFALPYGCNKIVLGADGNFYVCDKVFSFPSRYRDNYIIGSVNKGIDYKKRLHKLQKIFLRFLDSGGEKCLGCNFQKFCFCPLGLFLHCSETKKDFKEYFRSFCQVSKLYIETAIAIQSEIKLNPVNY